MAKILDYEQYKDDRVLLEHLGHIDMPLRKYMFEQLCEIGRFGANEIGLYDNLSEHNKYYVKDDDGTLITYVGKIPNTYKPIHCNRYGHTILNPVYNWRLETVGCVNDELIDRHGIMRSVPKRSYHWECDYPDWAAYDAHKERIKTQKYIKELEEDICSKEDILASNRRLMEHSVDTLSEALKLMREGHKALGYANVDAYAKAYNKLQQLLG